MRHPPKTTRRALIVGAISMSLTLCASTARAVFPERPVRLVVPFSAGGSVDAVARQLGQALAEKWKQPVVIDNRVGAGGNVAAELVSKSLPDGYTLLITSASLVMAPSVYRKPGFDPLRDFVSVTKVGEVPVLLLTSTRSTFKTTADLIALAKSQPGRLSFASAGIGSSLHLGSALFNFMAGIDAVHIPYRGGSTAIADLVGGKPEYMLNGIVDVLPLVKGGRLRALAVTTGKRAPQLPDVPTVAESAVPGYEFAIWQAIFLPAGTPPALVAGVHRDVTTLLRDPTVREHLQQRGMNVDGGSVAALDKQVREEVKLWADIVRKIGMTPE